MCRHISRFLLLLHAWPLASLAVSSSWLTACVVIGWGKQCAYIIFLTSTCSIPGSLLTWPVSLSTMVHIANEISDGLVKGQYLTICTSYKWHLPPSIYIYIEREREKRERETDIVVIIFSYLYAFIQHSISPTYHYHQHRFHSLTVYTSAFKFVHPVTL